MFVAVHIQEAAVGCRSLLQSLLTKIREKQSHIENAKSLIDRRNTEITQKERAVANEVEYYLVNMVVSLENQRTQCQLWVYNEPLSRGTPPLTKKLDVNHK